ncbi:hypothetical protein ACIPPJ_22400 [Streptomyces sp. NPDC086091]|uniref:hypothetical protein n=1 Tax=Streptomyces sp. NPDC086091 TaxID=3365751 RepID=UPI003811D329
MSVTVGAHTADPCPRCRMTAVRFGTPLTGAGRAVVRLDCEQCGHAWSRPVEDEVDVHDVVRVDLPESTVHGHVLAVEADRVLIAGGRGTEPFWVERWKVMVY